jgi:hypothetical protein
MEILENKAKWSESYHKGWLAHFQKTGTIDWKMYQHPKNRFTPGVPGITLSQSRLMLLSSAGAYLRESQPPFDAADPIGDYTLRTFPSSTPFDALAYAHGHFDHTMIEQDAQVGLPLRHLEAMVEAGEIGALAPSVVSFMGYQPDSARVVEEMVPELLAIASAEKVQAALLAPV